MPAINGAGAHRNDSDDIEVLVTGFGPFMGYAENPAWLSTKDLHDTYMSLASPSPPSPLQDPSTVTREKRIHIQVIQSSVVYSHVLSLVPLIHGVAPSAPEAQAYLDPAGDQPDGHSQTGPQGNGSPFPTGYPVRMPDKGHFDLVVHVGVGSRGAIAVEQLGHKRGYQIPDVKGELAPVATDQSETTRREKRPSEAEERERARFEMGSSLESPWSSPDVVRGFGRGYEEFEDEEVNSNDVASLVHWLKQECEVPPVRQSHDAGRYLCDYIYYCSLCEAKRGGTNTRVQFIHIPPTDEPHSTAESQATIEKIIWWLTCRGAAKGE